MQRTSSLRLRPSPSQVRLSSSQRDCRSLGWRRPAGRSGRGRGAADHAVSGIPRPPDGAGLPADRRRPRRERRGARWVLCPHHHSSHHATRPSRSRSRPAGYLLICTHGSGHAVPISRRMTPSPKHRLLHLRGLAAPRPAWPEPAPRVYRVFRRFLKMCNQFRNSAYSIGDSESHPVFANGMLRMKSAEP